MIIGAAVVPGMLGLPALTIKAGPLPSTIIILLAWLYVITSILLVAELCFDVMKEDGVEEVSFTSLTTRTLGSGFGAYIALVYTSLCFSLLVACVAGIGSIFSPCLPKLNTMILHSLFPLFVGILIVFFPFNTIDVANRLLCFLMLFSITGLIGIYVARANIISSFASISLNLSSILPIIPVAVLTLGFHVITPFMCKIAGNTVNDARKAILIGGTVPLIMVLSWNLIVLGLVGTNKAAAAANSGDPISLLLSVNPSALSAVQGFAFSAMATSLIGYAVSLPKQILDTLDLVFGKSGEDFNENGNGSVGLASYSGGDSVGCSGKVGFKDSRTGSEIRSNEKTFDLIKVLVTLLVLGFSVLIASYFKSTFSRALDFAGVYANCFLFGIIPPVMAYIHQSKKKTRFPVAYITQPTTKLHTKPAPFMAAFSSKGPNTIVPEILKPDITAPGVSINFQPDIMHQFKGSSSSIGAKKVKAECTLFREYCRTGNAEGCKKSFQQMKKEYAALRKKLETYFQLARQVGPLERASRPK